MLMIIPLLFMTPLKTTRKSGHLKVKYKEIRGSSRLLLSTVTLIIK